MTTEVNTKIATAVRSYQNFINGKWVASISGQSYERKSPVTGHIVHIPCGIGRELGHKGLEEYFETKSIQIKLG